MTHRGLTAAIALLAACAAGPAEGATGSDEPLAEAAYFKLHPDFLVNINGGDRPHFLLATVQVMSRSPDALAAIRHHAPALRHEMLLLLSEQDFANVEDVATRKKLSEDALGALNSVMERETGAGGVEALYFTNFVVE